VSSPPQRAPGRDFPSASRRPAFRLAALLLSAAAGCVSEPDSAAPLAALATPLPLRADAAGVFAGGEELRYDVAFGPLEVGELVYRTEELTTEDGPAWRFEGTSRPRGLFAAFAKAGGITRVVVDRATLFPRSSFWATAERPDPLVRTAAFDAADREVRTAAYAREWLLTRTYRGAVFFDPVSALFALRAIEPPPPGEERRLLSVEGVHLHLLTVRTEEPETIRLRPGGDERAALRLVVRGDRLDDEGRLTDAPPLNNFRLWLADEPRRTPLKLAGRIAFGGVTVVLREP
jgi:hypothetical protein